MLITCVSVLVQSHLLTHLSKLRGPAARFTVSERGPKEGAGEPRDQQQSRADRDPTGSRKRRVTVLRDLVAERVYDVPAEDVAASIIRDAIVVAAPAPARGTEHREAERGAGGVDERRRRAGSRGRAAAPAPARSPPPEPTASAAPAPSSRASTGRQPSSATPSRNARSGVGGEVPRRRRRGRRARPRRRGRRPGSAAPRRRRSPPPTPTAATRQARERPHHARATRPRRSPPNASSPSSTSTATAPSCTTMRARRPTTALPSPRQASARQHAALERVVEALEGHRARRPPAARGRRACRRGASSAASAGADEHARP